MLIFNRESNSAILLAGIFALIVGVGVARFVFTSLLPAMLEDSITIAYAGVLASINYVGYLTGSIFSVFIKDIHSKVKYFRFGLFICVISSFILGVTDNSTIWFIARLFAGFGAAMALVVGSAVVMLKLKSVNKTKAMGIHFSGLGFSILITDLVMRGVFYAGGNWQDAWIILAILGALLSCYSAYVLRFDKQPNNEVVKHKFDKSLFSPMVIILILAYFTEGIGMVVQATFLPDIVNSLQGLDGYGGYVWLAVGIAGVPSCIIWMRLAHRLGSINIMIVAMLLQIVGIIIPTLSSNIVMNLISGLLFGATFIGLVSLFMNFGGQLSKKNPVFIMGAITSAYGIGQILGPLYSVALIKQFGNYNEALYLTAAIVTMGILLLTYAKINYKEAKDTAQ
ncbi:YbfB/YjiJ family MFS transporter [Colwellia sp. 1_MG-2023]|uniref:YbfB/YjiJ family MFS transporter n=1 Tax=unclassified Colwellia TaxID=196834 RepID=UPI001C09758A|nr:MULTISPECIES: YbfB/YjiJ family MFS transporter [unclassified Colwellia]MBU2924349.1 YbfB/YjiJ family MFS transporter [Colwellia sp. C2M11]MDO6650849.1 YbfB/YjiJ family MFS transporter [Colwellia sp. 3_MG-2023]MDO6663884.1 YbfB/YjiJ family MFS transporter [Colwellia sp. 2_MG-2023]MDO6688235.1 YbfB/YjiJ family MFS transporter [Colwellia sp. 1_MG-2023]